MIGIKVGPRPLGSAAGKARIPNSKPTRAKPSATPHTVQADQPALRLLIQPTPRLRCLAPLPQHHSTGLPSPKRYSYSYGVHLTWEHGELRQVRAKRAAGTPQRG